MKKTCNYTSLDASKTSLQGNIALRGIDFESGNNIDPFKKRLEDYKTKKLACSKKKFDSLEEDLNEKYDLDTVEDTGVRIPSVKDSKSDRKPILKNWAKKVLIGVSIVTLGTSAYLISEMVRKHNRYIDTVEPYEKQITQIVDDNSKVSIVKYKLYPADLAEVNKKEYSYDYEGIAHAIEKSDNPDMLVFALYNKYSRNGDFRYNLLLDGVCRNLTYVSSSGNRSKGDFLKYASQWSGETDEEKIKDQYYYDCKKELIQDEDDDILDNIKIKVLKRR